MKYQSLSSPEPRWRWIAPHAIAFDGFRWHTRAFCETDACFKDFLFSRILGIRGARESEASADDDGDWQSEVRWKSANTPPSQKPSPRSWRSTMGCVGARRRSRSGALLHYALRHLGLGTDPGARKPQNQQIILLNREVVHEDH